MLNEVLIKAAERFNLVIRDCEHTQVAPVSSSLLFFIPCPINKFEYIKSSRMSWFFYSGFPLV